MQPSKCDKWTATKADAAEANAIAGNK
jgi:hypothetical protein